MDILRFLASVDILADLNSDEIKILAEAAQYLEYPDGAEVIKLGDIGRFLWIVYDGEVEVILPGANGGEDVIASLERGSVFGEMSIMTGEPAIATVRVSRKAGLVKILREPFSRIIATNPKTLSKVAKIITRRLMEDEKHAEESERKLAAFRENEDPYDLNFSSVAEPMRILVINCGSSSLKYALYDTESRSSSMAGTVERIGSGTALHRICTANARSDVPVPDVATAEDAMRVMMSTVTGFGEGNNIDAVGHRVVHGGARFSNSEQISGEVIEAIRDCISLAPLHNPRNLEGIEIMQSLLPGVPQVAVFDTAFHRTMPDTASVYAVPSVLAKEEGIRRYGFHGTNHRYVSLSTATFLKRPAGELKMISCHLGNGASVCAIDHGRSIDTSMGMTPLEGLIMGTRAGDIDPGVILHLMRHAGMSADRIDTLLNRESGLAGLSGISGDMREVLNGAEVGDIHCELAVSAFCYRVKKYIGSYIAALGGLDALIFTGGIGENSPEIRARVCQGLEVFGIALSDEANRGGETGRGAVSDISKPGSRVHILIVPADEEKMIARETIHTLGRAVPKEAARSFTSRPIPLSTSAHHVHLSGEDFAVLFGSDRTPTPKAVLSQPGQFAAMETVNLVGPKGRIEKVRILGPLRRESQVEISRTEQFKLGVDAPIRDSGDIEGTPGVSIEGAVGSVKLEKGLIAAKRHIHMSPEEALGLGLRDRDTVMVLVKGVRELIFGDVLVRVNPAFRMDMHLDTDEANAAQIAPGMVGYIESIQHRNYI